MRFAVVLLLYFEFVLMVWGVAALVLGVWLVCRD